jgi:hypothetical protein
VPVFHDGKLFSLLWNVTLRNPIPSGETALPAQNGSADCPVVLEKRPKEYPVD